MKFGKVLLKNQIPEWSRGYISYKVLKKLINNAVNTTNSQGGTVDDDTVIGFLFAVDRELEKVNDFFSKKLDHIEHRLRHLTEKYRHFYIPDPNNPSIDSGPNFDPYTDEGLLSALSEIKDQVHKLGHFADINKKGFVKILKKFDKRLGRENKTLYLETKVNVLPFASGSWFNETLDSIEHWIQEIHNQMEAYKKISYQNIKTRLRQINLTGEQNKMMMNSIYNDDTDILKILINPDLNTSSNSNIQNPIKKTLTSMLYKACHFRAMKCVKLLLDSGADIVDNDDINGRSLIHHLVIHNGKLPWDKSSPSTGSPTTSNAIREGLHMTYFTTAFLTQKNSKSDDDKFEDTSLLCYLLENILQTEYSKVSIRDAFGRSPLHYAAIRGFEKITKILLEFLIKTEQLSLERGFSEPSWFDNDGLSPPLYAVLRGHTTVVNCIINVAKIKNVDAVSVSNAADFYPAVNPTTNQHVTPFNTSHSHTQTPLAIACKFGHITTAKLLLAYGSDPNIQDEDGETPLHLAARGGFEDCVRLLVGLDVVDVDIEVPDDIKKVLSSSKSKLKKANVEIKENFYGWTPLFLAAVEGHTECVKVLIQANADPNITDNSGWTPYIHAVFHGYSHSAVKNFLRPLTVLKEPSRSLPAEINSKSKNKLNAPAEFYGHKYLQDQFLILITLGDTDTRKGVDPVEIYNTQISSLSIVPSTSISLIVYAKNATGEPVIVDLPVNALDSIMFYSSNIEEVILTFDVVPAYRTSKQLLGRATALLSSIKTSWGLHGNSLISSVTVPILGMNTLEVIGKVVFEVLIIKPFKHENLAVDSKRTYWKSVTTKVIGHRGFGMNRPITNLQLGENTLLSFVTAASLGAEYIEFDVQLTKDYTPVIYHDWTITETQYDIPVSAITLQQFLNLKRKETGISGRQVEKLLDRSIYKEFRYSDQNGIKQQGNDRGRKPKRSSSLGPVHTLTLSEKKEGKLKGNSDGTIQAPFTTLVETFKKLDVQIGFNIEVKYPMVDEAEEDGLQPYHIELNLFVDSILKCVFDHAQSRSIIFSSFHPDICLMLAFKQPNYPVFFLTDCGQEVKMADVRCNSLREAIRFAKMADLLGIVVTSSVIIEAPTLVKTIKETGLLTFSYGALNNDVTNVRLQKRVGVDAVIVDSVLAVRNGLQQND